MGNAQVLVQPEHSQTDDDAIRVRRIHLAHFEVGVGLALPLRATGPPKKGDGKPPPYIARCYRRIGEVAGYAERS